MAGPLRGGGAKAGPLRKKELFLKLFFFILLPFKNKNYFTLDNLSKYGHITLKILKTFFSNFDYGYKKVTQIKN